MTLDDLDPRQPNQKPLDLTMMSIEELTERIALLKSEITRCEAMIASKQSSRASAESVFKSG